MPRTNHPIFQVLVENFGTLLAAGNTVEDLNPGQIGFFNGETHLSFDNVNPLLAPLVKKFYIAVGVDRDADGTIDDVNKSCGDNIYRNHIHKLEIKCPEECRSNVVLVTPSNIKGDTTYTLKIQFFNQSTLQVEGFYHPTKNFIVKSPCCESTSYCSCDDQSVCCEVIRLLVNAVNLDPDGIFTAYMYDTLTGTIVTADNYAAWRIANPDACLSMFIVGSCETINSYCMINYNYKKTRAFHMTVSFTDESLNVGATITEVVPIRYPQGQGYDVRALENLAGGWNGKPGVYRQNDLVGGPVGNFETFAVNGTDYVLINIGHDAMSVIGFQEPINDMETILAIPCAEEGETVLTSVIAVLNLLSLMDEATPLVLPDGCCEEESESFPEEWEDESSSRGDVQ